MARKLKICIEPECQNQATSAKYCRMHYIKNWQAIKAAEKTKAAKKLNRYVEGIMKRSPDKTKPEEKLNELDFAADAQDSDSLAEDIGYTDPDGVNDLITRIKVDN